MKPSSSLKLRSVIFTVLWIAAMLWWDGPVDRANIILTSAFGVAAGYTWYRIMRRLLVRGKLPPRSVAGLGAKS
jgi:hypothetical protein